MALISGSPGNDTLNGIPGSNTLIGGPGSDTYVTDGNDTIFEYVDQGIDTVQSQVTYTLGEYLENLILTGPRRDAPAINGTGNSWNNVITGNSSANILDGGAGDDILDGGQGADTLIGGLGNDTYITDGLDVITFALSRSLIL